MADVRIYDMTATTPLGGDRVALDRNDATNRYTSLAEISSAIALSVTDIDDPSTELNAIAGTVKGERRLCYETAAGKDEFTMYAWDDADSGAESVPHTVDGSSGIWTAIAGRYVDSSVDINGSLYAFGTVTGSNLSGNNTGDEVSATESVEGITQLATQAETDTGTDDIRIVTPLKLANYSGLSGPLTVEDNTAVSASPNILTSGESGSVMSNKGATATNYHTLPQVTAGLEYTFVDNDASDLMRIVCDASGGVQKIRVGASISVATGYVESTAQGDVIKLLGMDAEHWLATTVIGSWNLETS